MVRNPGKFGKQKRGGGRSFSRNLELDENGTAVSKDKRRGQEEGSDEDSDAISEEEEEEESSEEEEVAPQSTSAEPEMSRAQRKELKKQQGAKKAAAEEDDEDEDLINPNHVKKQLTISDLGKPKELTRREREQKEKQDAKDRYWKLHLAGKTDQAKADLGRLAKIKAEREAAQERRKAETEAKEAEIAAKSKAQREGKRA